MFERMRLVLADSEMYKFLVGLVFVAFWAIAALFGQLQKKKEEQERQKRRSQKATYERKQGDLPPVLPPLPRGNTPPPPLPGGSLPDGGQVRTRAEMERRMEEARRRRRQQQEVEPEPATIYTQPTEDVRIESDMERARRQQEETRREQEMLMRQQEAARQELERRRKEIERQRRAKAERDDQRRRAEAAEVTHTASAASRREVTAPPVLLSSTTEERHSRAGRANEMGAADAASIRKWLTPATLRQQYVLTEIFSPPVALRPGHLD